MWLKNLWRATTNALKKAGTLIFLITLIALWNLPTTSYAEVKAVDSNTIQMTADDLRALVRTVLENEALNKALKEALDSERASFHLYRQHVDELITAHAAERQAMQSAIKQLERQLNRPRLEAYGGYNTKNQVEGGIRLIWVLK